MKHRFPHMIKPNAGREIPRYNVFVDTETHPDRKKIGSYTHKLKLGWGCFWDRGTSTVKERLEWYYFETTGDFWEWLNGRLPEKSRVVFWAHNTDFDFRVLKGFKYLSRIGFEVKNPILEADTTIMRFRKGTRTILVLDTFNFFKTSLAKLGHDLGIEKGAIEFNTCSMKELKDYCRQDVAIILEAIKQMYAFISDEDLGMFKPTISSLALTAYKHRFMEYPIFVHTNPLVVNLERASYRGGRSEAFRIGDVSDIPNYCLDVNSMYPSVMEANEFPTKLKYTDWNPTVERCVERCIEGCCIADVEFTIEEPAIAVKRERLLFPVGNIRAVLTSPEIVYLAAHAKINKCYTLVQYESAPMFRDYMGYFYAKRREYKEKGNFSYSLFTKYLLNTLYGKFGQRNQEIKIVGDMKPGEEDNTFTYFDSELRKNITEYHIQGKIYVRDGYYEGWDTLVAIPSFVTAYGRMRLWALMVSAGRENVLYVDTDSLYVTKDGYDNLQPEIDNYQLGALKLEEYSLKHIMGAKWYKTTNEWVIKGIRKDAVEVEPNVYRQLQFERYKTALRKKEPDSVVSHYVTKTLNTTYKKGVVLKCGRVAPFEFVKDNMTQEEIEDAKAKEAIKRMGDIERMNVEERKRARAYIKESDQYEPDNTLTAAYEQGQAALREMKRDLRD